MSDKKQNNKNFYSDNRIIIRTLLVAFCFLGAFSWANFSLNRFTSGTPISSADVNKNFDDIASQIFLTNGSSQSYPENCASFEHVQADATGIIANTYNTGNGQFTLSDSGVYQIIYKFKCTGCSKQQVHLCKDSDFTPDDCFTGSGIAAGSIYIGDFDNSGFFSSRYVELVGGETYRIVFQPCTGGGTFDVAAAGDVKIFIKKVL